MEKRQELIRRLCKLEAERDSLKEKLGSFFSSSAKGDTYYRWLVEKMQSAKSEQEYTALAKKFSDISEYKDCAELADKCKQRLIK